MAMQFYGSLEARLHAVDEGIIVENVQSGIGR